MPESAPHKVWRHLKEGPRDIPTVTRGIHYLGERLVLGSFENSVLCREGFDPCFLGINGLKVFAYNLSVPRRGSLPGRIQTPIRVYQFPSGLYPRIDVLPDKAQVHTREHLLRLRSQAALEFVGPTFFLNTKLPNNGFYHDGKMLIPFGETNPPGQRRGAIGFKEDQSVQLMTDQEKWTAINDNFAGFCAVAGTSYWLSSDDQNTDPTDPVYHSYLVQSRSKPSTMGYMIAGGLITRKIVLDLLNDAAMKEVFPDFIAVELEEAGTCCIVKNGDSFDHFGYTGFNSRRDHYYLEF